MIPQPKVTSVNASVLIYIKFWINIKINKKQKPLLKKGLYIIQLLQQL